MDHKKILAEAYKPNSNQLLWLIADLEHMQKVKEYNEIQPQLQDYSKGGCLPMKTSLILYLLIDWGTLKEGLTW